MSVETLQLDYLGPRDEPWLRALLDECSRLVGASQGEFRERLKQPLAVRAPRHKLRAVARLLERLLPEVRQRESAPREARARLFRAAAASAAPREQVLWDVANQLGMDAPALEHALFSDLAGQRPIGPVPPDLSPARLALLVNQALVHGVLRRASRVRIRAWGHAPALMRHAQRLGLICVASVLVPPSPPPSGVAAVELELSGPFALFRRTELYGRALASLLPSVARCDHFELEAECQHPPQAGTLRLCSSDPVFAANEPAAFDSRAELRFIQDFTRLGALWTVEREPAPIVTGGRLFAPDLALAHVAEPALRWWLEMVGFWTPDYLREKLARWESAGIERFVMCVDIKRGCADEAAPSDPRIVYYNCRIDAQRVLALLTSSAAAHVEPVAR